MSKFDETKHRRDHGRFADGDGYRAGVTRIVHGVAGGAAVGDLLEGSARIARHMSATAGRGLPLKIRIPVAIWHAAKESKFPSTGFKVGAAVTGGFTLAHIINEHKEHMRDRDAIASRVAAHRAEMTARFAAVNKQQRSGLTPAQRKAVDAEGWRGARDAAKSDSLGDLRKEFDESKHRRAKGKFAPSRISPTIAAAQGAAAVNGLYSLIHGGMKSYARNHYNTKFGLGVGAAARLMSSPMVVARVRPALTAFGGAIGVVSARRLSAEQLGHPLKRDDHYGANLADAIRVAGLSSATYSTVKYIPHAINLASQVTGVDAGPWVGHWARHNKKIAAAAAALAALNAGHNIYNEHRMRSMGKARDWEAEDKAADEAFDNAKHAQYKHLTNKQVEAERVRDAKGRFAPGSIGEHEDLVRHGTYSEDYRFHLATGALGGGTTVGAITALARKISGGRKSGTLMIGNRLGRGGFWDRLAAGAMKPAERVAAFHGNKTLLVGAGVGAGLGALEAYRARREYYDQNVHPVHATAGKVGQRAQLVGGAAAGILVGSNAGKYIPKAFNYVAAEEAKRRGAKKAMTMARVFPITNTVLEYMAKHPRAFGVAGAAIGGGLMYNRMHATDRRRATTLTPRED